MKKLYTLAMAMGIAASAMAVSPSQLANEAKAMSFDRINRQVAECMLSEKTRLGGDLYWDDLNLDDFKQVGYVDFQDNIVSAFFSNVSDDVKQVLLLESESTPGVYCVVNPWNVPDPEEGMYTLIIDARVPQCVFIPEQPSNLGNDNIGTLWFLSTSQWYMDNNLRATSYQDFLDDPQYSPRQNIYVSNKCIYFPVRSIRYSMPDATEESGINPSSYYIGLDKAGYLTLPGGEYKDPWEYAGEATFVDGLVAPWFTNDGNGGSTWTEDNFTFQVPYQIHCVTGEMRLYDPYQWIYGTDIEDMLTDIPVLTFDLTDPANVILPQNPTCIYEEGDGALTIMGLYPNFVGATSLEEMEENFPDQIITYNANTRTITFPKNSALMNFSEYEGGNSWFSLNEQFAQVGYITLPDTSGIGAVSSDVNAPVQYFNIQGMRINQPVKGQLVIVRKGNKSTKEIAK